MGEWSNNGDPPMVTRRDGYPVRTPPPPPPQHGYEPARAAEFGGLGGGGLGGRGGNMATRKVKCALVVVISVLFCPNLPRPARQRGRAWEAATTAAAAKAAANNS
jgi:hypothetical protein